MFRLVKVKKYNISQLNRVTSILNACGKDMAERYNLHHWDNTYIKSFAIVELCSFKNDIFLLFENDKPIATFMTRIQGDKLHFEKLATLPSESGKGIGSLCIERIEDIARNNGCILVAMEVFEPSQHAISFYEHRGYKVVGMTETLKYKEFKMVKRV